MLFTILLGGGQTRPDGEMTQGATVAGTPYVRNFPRYNSLITKI